MESVLDDTLMECQLWDIKVNILKHRFDSLIQAFTALYIQCITFDYDINDINKNQNRHKKILS